MSSHTSLIAPAVSHCHAILSENAQIMQLRLITSE